MPRSLRLAPLWALLTACGSGIGVTDASSVTTTGASDTPPGTGSNSGTPTTGAPVTTGTASTSDEGTASATGSTADPTTSTSTTSPTSGSTGGSTTTASSTGDPSTGELLGCVDVTADYGDCATPLGYGFDGTTCRAFSGCDCAPNCDHFAPEPTACASACAAAGQCNEAVIKAEALAMDPVQQGSFCDEVDACAAPDSELATWLTMLFPGLQCEPGFPCDAPNSCHLQFQGEITAELWKQLCAASLLPDASLHCVVFGP